MTARRLAPPYAALRRQYVERKWQLYRIAAYYHTTRPVVVRWLTEYGIPISNPIPVPEAVHRKVDHYEDLPYHTTWNGTVLTKTVAILECGHKCPVSQRMDPDDYSYRPVKTCKVCTQKGTESDGGQGSGTQ